MSRRDAANEARGRDAPDVEREISVAAGAVMLAVLGDVLASTDRHFRRMSATGPNDEQTQIMLDWMSDFLRAFEAASLSVDAFREKLGMDANAVQ